MLEKLVNNDRDGADQLFHEFVIEKSRSIYETMLESDLEDLDVKEESEEEEVDEATDEEVDESSDDEEVDESTDEEVDESDEDEVEESFDEFTPEADPMGGDASDDMLGDIEADGDMDMGDAGEEGEEELEDRVVDLEDALDDLKAEFEKMMSNDDEDEGEGDDAEMDMGDEEGDEEKEEAFDADSELSVDEVPAFEGKKSAAEQMREYVEKVATPKGEDNKAKSPVAGKNDMGGTTANIAQGGDEAGGKAAAPKEDNMGNVNVPGGKASKSLSNAKGHGAEKKGAGESGANTKSTIGS